MTIPINDSHAIPPDADAAAALARLGDVYAEPAARACPSCPHCGETFHVEDVPAKTHDLWVRKQLFGTLVAAESETDDRRVFILAGSTLDLGRVLDALTPAQVRLLVDDLTGDES